MAHHVRSVRCKVTEVHIARDHPKKTEITIYHRDKSAANNIFFRTSDTVVECQPPVGRSAQYTLDQIRNEHVKEINQHDFTYFSSDMGRGDGYRDHKSMYHLPVHWLDNSPTTGCAPAGAREALKRRGNPILLLCLWMIPSAGSIMPPVCMINFSTILTYELFFISVTVLVGFEINTAETSHCCSLSGELRNRFTSQ